MCFLSRKQINDNLPALDRGGHCILTCKEKKWRLPLRSKCNSREQIYVSTEANTPVEKNVWNNGFQDTGHQPTKNSDLWEMEVRIMPLPSGLQFSQFSGLESCRLLSKKGECRQSLADSLRWRDQAESLETRMSDRVGKWENASQGRILEI